MNSLGIKVKNAPQKPGVYIFKSKNKIIYVGKAKNLKKRVHSYFLKKHTDAKTAILVKKIDDVEFTVTQSEIEALILENNFIKKYRPVYNISFKDDKTYPFIAVSVDDEYPKIIITRERHKKGVAYFGPYTNVRALRQTFDTLRRIFPLRNCRGSKPGRKGTTPCLNFHIKRCLGPCAGEVAKKEYDELVKQVLLFLDGKGESVIKALEGRMKFEAANQNFEEAARIRNRLSAAKEVIASQEIVSSKEENMDVLGLAESKGYLSISVFVVRNGKLISTDNFNFEKGLEVDPLSSFIKRFYIAGINLPKMIICAQISEVEALESWLYRELKKIIIILIPQRGRKRKLLEMASKNAGYAISLHLKKLDIEASNALLAIRQLSNITGAKTLKRIECFDVSNISGTHAVASMSVFENGVSLKKDYRKFRIIRVKGIDDYAMIGEALSRRFSNSKGKKDSSFSKKPDLVVIDGGRGQLSTAVKVTEGYSKDINIISIAKKEEEIYLKNKKEPVNLDESDPALHLIQQIRDEAHRFAITYHQKLRSKALKQSLLDEIDGIGEGKKKALIKKFGSVGKIKESSLEEVAKTPGINKKLAESIHEKLKNSP